MRGRVGGSEAGRGIELGGLARVRPAAGARLLRRHPGKLVVERRRDLSEGREGRAASAGVTAVANAVHYHHVGSNVRPAELPSTVVLFQIVVLAYRLAWQARDVIEQHEA